MSLVSWLLFFCSRVISSEMSTAESSWTYRSSSIFACSSAIGCSKSRNVCLSGGAGMVECDGNANGRARHSAAAYRKLQEENYRRKTTGNLRRSAGKHVEMRDAVFFVGLGNGAEAEPGVKALEAMLCRDA